MKIERQELHCHGCNGYVQFDIDVELDGNHVLHCPRCGHEHCRVVRDGVITGIRWDVRHGPTYQVSTGNVTYTTASTWDSCTDQGTAQTGNYLYVSWMNTTAAN
jgi:hypothetical protein